MPGLRIAAVLLVTLTPALAVEPIDYDAVARDARRTLDRLVAADTTNPPGNEARAVRIGVERLKSRHVPYVVTTFAPGRQNLVARLKGRGTEPPLLLLAHTDVVGAAGQQWTSPPHQVTERDGYLVGRGVDDDLGMAAVALEVLLAVKQSTLMLRRDVILAWTGDEESGGGGIRWLLEHARPSITAAVALNEGGGPRLDDQGRVVRVELQTAEKTYQDFTIVARGPTGHSSVPVAGNAIYRLAHGLDGLAALRFPVRLIPTTRAYFTARAAQEEPRLADAMRRMASADGEPPADAVAVLDEVPDLAAALRTTCVATLLAAGTRVNALPAEATATVNCRIIPGQSVDEVRAAIVGALGDAELVVTASSEFGWGEPSPLDRPGPDAIRAVSVQMWPGVPVVPFMSRGATDARFLRAAGIAAYGLDPVPVSEVDARRAHGIDERIPAASLRTGVEYLHRLVVALAGPPR